uniref:Helitron helicase n=1 Tax=Heterorhabditis bacteriophora TaxID=37862 RepID=A0A1I7XE88_HETBA
MCIRDGYLESTEREQINRMHGLLSMHLVVTVNIDPFPTSVKYVGYVDTVVVNKNRFINRKIDD